LRTAPLSVGAIDGVVKSNSRSAQRFSTLFSTPIEARRSPAVPVLSSTASIPLPRAASRSAVARSSSSLAGESMEATGEIYYSLPRPGSIGLKLA